MVILTTLLLVGSGVLISTIGTQPVTLVNENPLLYYYYFFTTRTKTIVVTSVATEIETITSPTTIPTTTTETKTETVTTPTTVERTTTVEKTATKTEVVTSPTTVTTTASPPAITPLDIGLIVVVVILIGALVYVLRFRPVK